METRDAPGIIRCWNHQSNIWGEKLFCVLLFSLSSYLLKVPAGTRQHRKHRQESLCKKDYTGWTFSCCDQDHPRRSSFQNMEALSLGSSTAPGWVVQVDGSTFLHCPSENSNCFRPQLCSGLGDRSSSAWEEVGHRLAPFTGCRLGKEHPGAHNRCLRAHIGRRYTWPPLTHTRRT